MAQTLRAAFRTTLGIHRCIRHADRSWNTFDRPTRVPYSQGFPLTLSRSDTCMALMSLRRVPGLALPWLK